MIIVIARQAVKRLQAKPFICIHLDNVSHWRHPCASEISLAIVRRQGKRRKRIHNLPRVLQERKREVYRHITSMIDEP
jgi:hypothetical protein